MISFCSKINTFFSDGQHQRRKRTENKVQTIARFLHLLRGVILKIFLKFSSDCRLAVCLIFFHSSSGCRLDCSHSFAFVVNVSFICRSKSFNGLLPTASFLHLQTYIKKRIIRQFYKKVETTAIYSLKTFMLYAFFSVTL